MSKKRSWLDKIFPSDEGQHRTNELVEQGLEALRSSRDERAFTMGDIRRVPSRLELRISPERYEELMAMDAVRDLEFFFNDELMKDLAAEQMRTFGDHAVHVTVAADAALARDEIYAEVLAPEAIINSGTSTPKPSAGADSTRVLGEPEPAQTQVSPVAEHKEVPTWKLLGAGPNDFKFEARLDGRYWVIGRRGSSGRQLPPNYRKLDLDVPETISREQARVELFEDRFLLERIGKGPVGLAGGEQLADAGSRMLPMGSWFTFGDYEFEIVR